MNYVETTIEEKATEEGEECMMKQNEEGEAWHASCFNFLFIIFYLRKIQQKFRCSSIRSLTFFSMSSFSDELLLSPYCNQPLRDLMASYFQCVHIIYLCLHLHNPLPRHEKDPHRTHIVDLLLLLPHHPPPPPLIPNHHLHPAAVAVQISNATSVLRRRRILSSVGVGIW